MFSSDVPGVRMVRSEKKTVRSEKRSTHRYPAQAKSSFIQNSKTKNLFENCFRQNFRTYIYLWFKKCPKSLHVFQPFQTYES